MTNKEIKAKVEEMCGHLAKAHELFKAVRENAKQGDCGTFDVLRVTLDQDGAELHAYNCKNVIKLTDESNRNDTEYPKERFTFVNGIKVFRLVHQTEIESEAM